MKKNFLVTLLFVTSIIQFCYAADPGKPLQMGNPGIAITSLVINANVAIVLINDPGRQINMAGDSLFMKSVTFKQTSNNLIITAQKKWDFRSKGIIYVPADSLKNIKINSAANLRSSHILQLPNLEISVNGECQINILIQGKVELSGNDLYDIDYQAREISESILKTRKK